MVFCSYTFTARTRTERRRDDAALIATQRLCCSERRLIDKWRLEIYELADQQTNTTVCVNQYDDGYIRFVGLYGRMSTDSLVISVNHHKDFTSCSLNVRYVHVLSIHEQSPHTNI